GSGRCPDDAPRRPALAPGARAAVAVRHLRVAATRAPPSRRPRPLRRRVARTSALPPRGRRIAADALVMCAVTLLVVALARPQWGESRAAVERSSRNVLFVLDLSRSMNAADAYPSRLAQAKAAARAIADSLPHDRVGLEVFGGN